MNFNIRIKIQRYFYRYFSSHINIYSYQLVMFLARVILKI